MDDVERHKILSMCPRGIRPTVLVRRARDAGIRNPLHKIKKLFQDGVIKKEGDTFLIASGEKS